MHRFYVNSSIVSNDSIVIVEKGLVHHIKEVLRLKRGDTVIAFDERANEYSASVERVGPKEITLKICEKTAYPVSEGKGLCLTVACALPKKSKFDSIVNGLTQLGVDRIVPLLTQRVIIKLDDKKARAKRDRWVKIALQASQQAQRATLPIIDEPVEFNELLSRFADFDFKLLPTLEGKRKYLKEVFPSGAQGNVLICIGPEGDFSEKEIESALGAGFVPLSLGTLVLRVETAALAAAAIIKSYENR